MSTTLVSARTFPLALAALLVAGSTAAWSATDGRPGPALPAASAPAPAGQGLRAGAHRADMERYRAQMKSMHEVHERLMAATTPDERKAVMTEHMKVMKDGMGMLKGMPSGMNPLRGHPVSIQMMATRMEMMQAMMEMMMDRLPATPSN